MGSRPYGEKPLDTVQFRVQPSAKEGQMQRYLCPSCHAVTEASVASRYAWCTACGQPLSLFDLLPVRPGAPARGEEPTPVVEVTAGNRFSR
jgi:hypothetical protein